MASNIVNMTMSSEFLNNFNVMYLASFLFLGGLSVITYILNSDKRKSKMGIASISILKQSAVTLALFNALNIGFSIGLHLKYSGTSQVSPVFHHLGTIAIIIVLIALVSLLVVL